MKLGIVSDVHGNLWALKEVLEHMKSQGVDKKICLGDIIGYGPFPNECVELTVENFNFILMGNHDNAVFDKKNADDLNPIAKAGIEWTAKKIRPENVEFLKNLEYGFVTEQGLMFVHGSPSEPFEYITQEYQALYGFNMPIEEYRVAFIGHTHVPKIWKQKDDATNATYVSPLFNSDKESVSQWSHELQNNGKSIINVGSVGQPRDNDKRACYVIFDTETNTVTYFRIPYPVDKTIARMQQYGLPSASWARLMYGQ